MSAARGLQKDEGRRTKDETRAAWFGSGSSFLLHPSSFRRRGATATELALLLPVLMLLALAIVDFGRIAYAHIALGSAARAGAAHGIMNPFAPESAGAWEQQVQQKARDEMEQQTGYDPSLLTTTTSVSLEETGLRRVRVQASFSSFETIVRWPGIPGRLTL